MMGSSFGGPGQKGPKDKRT